MKEKELTKNDKKIKRKKVWGTICICFGIFMLVEGLALGLILKETAILLSLCIEGNIILIVGIILKTKSKSLQQAADKTPVIEEIPIYKLSDIIDDESRKEIYAHLDTLAKMYNNFFEGSDYANNPRSLVEKFSSLETETTKEEWLSAASYLEQFS